MNVLVSSSGVTLAPEERESLENAARERNAIVAKYDGVSGPFSNRPLLLHSASGSLWAVLGFKVHRSRAVMHHCRRVKLIAIIPMMPYASLLSICFSDIHRLTFQLCFTL